jgi:hypothetical protein
VHYHFLHYQYTLCSSICCDDDKNLPSQSASFVPLYAAMMIRTCPLWVHRDWGIRSRHLVSASDSATSRNMALSELMILWLWRIGLAPSWFGIHNCQFYTSVLSGYSAVTNFNLCQVFHYFLVYGPLPWIRISISSWLIFVFVLDRVHSSLGAATERRHHWAKFTYLGFQVQLWQNDL